ncbi:MAG: hypothetical protein ACOYZ8_18375 [Chloroflexota bacterium]
MNTAYKYKPGDGLGALFRSFTRGRRLSRGAAWGVMIVGALLAFELFNYSTTEFALNDVLGDLKFAGIRWATILAIAFCGIDFAGIARMFTPEQGADEPAEVWYLFGAWLLAAAMNATLTWWGVSVAIVNNSSLGGGVVVSNATLTKAVPVFVAVMVWLIRVLIIGTFSVAGERLFSQDNQRNYRPVQTTQQRSPAVSNAVLRPASSLGRPAAKPMTQATFNSNRAEPTYHNLNYTAQPQQKSIGFYDPSREQ